MAQSVNTSSVEPTFPLGMPFPQVLSREAGLAAAAVGSVEIQMIAPLFQMGPYSVDVSPGPQPCMLVVEDDPSSVELLTDIFDCEYRILFATEGMTALKMAEINMPTVILLDVMMPGIDGYEVCRRLKAEVRTKEIPIIFITGLDDDASEIRGLELGAADYISKPLNPSTIRARVNNQARLRRAQESSSRRKARSLFEEYMADVEASKSLARTAHSRELADVNELLRVEKEVLDETLMATIKLFTEVISAASPEIFGRSRRIEELVGHIAGKFKLLSPWRLEAAAALSQLGCVSVDPDVIQRSYLGGTLSPEDWARFNAHPKVAMDLLATIPTLEQVAWMIGQQRTRDIPKAVSGVSISTAADIVLGATILKLAVAFDELRMKPLSDEDAIARLRGRSAEFEPELLDALADVKPAHVKMALRKVAISKLATGMILDQEIRNMRGMLVVSKGQEITPSLLIKLDNFSRAGLIDKEVRALVPV